jgi:hypothetical protein
VTHRRQYIPGSHVKISRAEQKAINERLREELHQRDAAERRYRAQERDERQRRETTGVRGFINKTKKFLTRPIFQKSRVA